MHESRTILQVNANDVGGGAETIAWCLHHAYRARGHQAWLAVGKQTTDHAHVLRVPENPTDRAWTNFWSNLARPLWRYQDRVRPLWRLIAMLNDWARYPVMRAELTGVEYFNAPGTRRLPQLPPTPPDLLHLHCLHGGFFDVRQLPRLTRRFPTVFTLHDEWIYTGHCGLSLDCLRWQTGCGACPHPESYPPIQRDRTAYNWQRKRHAFQRSRLYLASPSQWLLDRAQQSPLALGVREARVIPNGIDLTVFHPGDQAAARAELGLPPQARILLFIAYQVRKNAWKDYPTVQDAVARLAAALPGEEIVLVALGEDAPEERIGNARILFIPFARDTAVVATYCRAADVYVHAAKVDNFPTVVLEALACGTPVVATAVGGIPEQIIEGETGHLVPPGDAAAMAARLQAMLSDAAKLQQMRDAAAAVARARYDDRRMAETYLAWYEEIMQSTRKQWHTQ